MEELIDECHLLTSTVSWCSSLFLNDLIGELVEDSSALKKVSIQRRDAVEWLECVPKFHDSRYHNFKSSSRRFYVQIAVLIASLTVDVDSHRRLCGEQIFSTSRRKLERETALTAYYVESASARVVEHVEGYVVAGELSELFDEHIGLLHEDSHVILKDFPAECRCNHPPMRLPHVGVGGDDSIAYPLAGKLFVHERLLHRVLMLENDFNIVGIGDKYKEKRPEPRSQWCFVLQRELVNCFVQTCRGESQKQFCIYSN